MGFIAPKPVMPIAGCFWYEVYKGCINMLTHTSQASEKRYVECTVLIFNYIYAAFK